MKFTQVLRYSEDIAEHCKSHEGESFGYNLDLVHVERATVAGVDSLILQFTGSGEAYKTYCAMDDTGCIFHGFLNPVDFEKYSQKIQGLC